jgi:hypothetical protein
MAMASDCVQRFWPITMPQARLMAVRLTMAAARSSAAPSAVATLTAKRTALRATPAKLAASRMTDSV